MDKVKIFSEDEVIGALEQLRAALRGVGAPVAWNMRPGLTPEEVKSLSARLPYQLPADVAAVFTWHDGAEGDPNEGDLSFLPDGDFHCLREVINHYEIYRDTAIRSAMPNYPAEWSWDNTALPLFPGDLGAHCTWVALCGEATAAGTPCGFWDVVNDGLTEVYPSVAAAVRHVTLLIETGRVEFDPGPGLVATHRTPQPIVRTWPGDRP